MAQNDEHQEGDKKLVLGPNRDTRPCRVKLHSAMPE